MDGVWLEDGSFRPAPGARARLKGKGKGGKGKDKDGLPQAKRLRVEPVAETEEEYFEREWRGKQVCLVNLKSEALNGCMGCVKAFLGSEQVLVEGKKRVIKRYLVELDGGLGEKSIKFENLFKVMTGSLVKLRGLDATELNEVVAECGKLDPKAMRYCVTLPDGRPIKVKPSSVEFLARYDGSALAAGTEAQVDLLRRAGSIRDAFALLEKLGMPPPQLLPAAALAQYAHKFPKSIVIGHSKAANPKGAAALAREVTSSLCVPPDARVVFASVPRERCIAPVLTDMRHDDLLRLGKFADWAIRRCSPRPVLFLLPGVAAKGPAALLDAATVAWPLYLSIVSEVLLLESARWDKSAWAQLDALLAHWAWRPLYVLPDPYVPPVELGSAPPGEGGSGRETEHPDETETPFTLKAEEVLRVARPVATEKVGISSHLKALQERALEAFAEAGDDTSSATLALDSVEMMIRRL